MFHLSFHWWEFMHCSPSKGDIVIVGKTLVGWVGDCFFACHKLILLTAPLQKLDDFCELKMNFDCARAFGPHFSAPSFATSRSPVGASSRQGFGPECSWSQFWDWPVGQFLPPRCALGVVNEIAHLGCKIVNSLTLQLSMNWVVILNFPW